MKKNLLSILILALLVVNIILSSVTMLSVMTTNQKTASIVKDIAGILDIELNQGKEAVEEEVVSINDTSVYNIEEQMTIALKKDTDGKEHYCVVSVTLAMNKDDKDFKKYNETVKDYEGLIKGEIITSVGYYTASEAEISQEDLRQDILDRIQKLYDSKFIYKVTFRDFIIQ